MKVCLRLLFAHEKCRRILPAALWLGFGEDRNLSCNRTGRGRVHSKPIWRRDELSTWRTNRIVSSVRGSKPVQEHMPEPVRGSKPEPGPVPERGSRPVPERVRKPARGRVHKPAREPGSRSARERSKRLSS